MHELRLELLAPAWNELEQIADRHLFLVGASSAQKITDKLLDCLDNLKTNPYLGIECTESILKSESYRKLICGNYLCFYKVFSDAVYVYHIADGRTDYPKLFEQYK